MPTAGVRKTVNKKKQSFARLTPAVRNRILGMSLGDVAREDMRDKVHEIDGANPSMRAVDAILANFQEDPQWDGKDSCAGCRPRTLTPKHEMQVKRILDHDAGKFVIAARCVKKKVLAFRNVRDEIVQQTFFRIGYA